MKNKPLRIFCFLVLCFFATTLNAQEIDSLKNEIDYLKQKLNKIDELELRLAELERDSVAVQQNLSPKFVPDSTAKGLEQVPKQDLRDQNIVPLSGSDLVASEFVGSWPMFGTIFRMKIGGYVKTHFLYDITLNDDRTQFLLAHSVIIHSQRNHADDVKSV